MKSVRDVRQKRLEVLLWSIAFPGFGQFLNKKYIKAIVFIILEFMINIGGNINKVIVSSFILDTEQAILEADYLWLMFYPCIYVFAIWDAYRDAGGGEFPFIFIPYVIAAYTGTLGVIYSFKTHIQGFYIGPVFLPIMTMIGGFIIGVYVRKLLCRNLSEE